MRTMIALIALILVVIGSGFCGCIEQSESESESLNTTTQNNTLEISATGGEFTNTLLVTEGLISDNGSRYTAPTLISYRIPKTTTATDFYAGLGYNTALYKHSEDGESDMSSVTDLVGGGM